MKEVPENQLVRYMAIFKPLLIPILIYPDQILTNRVKNVVRSFASYAYWPA